MLNSIFIKLYIHALCSSLSPKKHDEQNMVLPKNG